MWELLQKLEDLGWKPYGKSIAELTETEKNVRLLTSRSSGLWQFVCENGMLNKKRWSNRVRLETSSVGDYIEIWTGEDYGGKFDNDYEYRLIESSLKDESELEQFLLNNIKL